MELVIGDLGDKNDTASAQALVIGDLLMIHLLRDLKEEDNVTQDDHIHQQGSGRSVKSFQVKNFSSAFTIRI